MAMVFVGATCHARIEILLMLLLVMAVAGGENDSLCGNMQAYFGYVRSRCFQEEYVAGIELRIKSVI